MEKTQSFEQLLVWQKAHEFVLLFYKTTETFPKHEIFGLTHGFEERQFLLLLISQKGTKGKIIRIRSIF